MKLFKRKNNDLRIMKPTDSDIDTVAEMMTKAMVQQKINKKVLVQTLKTPNVIVLVAKLKQRVVGLITGLVFPASIPPPRIDFLAVPDKESAQKGLHGVLIDEFIEELKKRNPRSKYVDTNIATTNPNLVAIYSLKGFLVIGFTKGQESLGDIVVLRKNIAKKTALNYTV